MQEVHAADLANNLIKLMVQHQQNLFGSAPANCAENAKTTAQALAALRAELIEQLKQQP